LPRALALETERLLLLDGVERMYAGRSVYENLVALQDGKEPTPERTLRLFVMVPMMAGRSRALACAETLGARMLAVGAMPTFAGLLIAPDVDAEIRALPHSQLVVRVMAPSFGRAMRSWALVEAQVAGVRTMIAIELFRAERGAWPRELGELVPAYLPRGLEDPYTGDSLRYRVEAGGYVLYSVGLDRHDDGGREHEDGPVKAAFEEGAGFDIVFRAAKSPR
jgi:hypothetical protein